MGSAYASRYGWRHGILVRSGVFELLRYVCFDLVQSCQVVYGRSLAIPFDACSLYIISLKDLF